MRKKSEARGAGRRSRAPGVCWMADNRNISGEDRAVQRIARQFGVSLHLAAVVAQLAGIGREAAR